MPLVTLADSFYIGVFDLPAATAWYTEKLGLQKVSVEMDDAEGCRREPLESEWTNIVKVLLG